MKETKVYVDELPEICDECPCHSVMEDRCVLLRKQAIEPFLQSCPLKSLKTHDRKLVTEVCEKIRTMAHKVGKLVFCEHCYKTNSARAIDEHLLNEILGQIESEFEQKEFEK